MKSSVGKDLEIPYRPAVAIPITLNFKLPILFSRSRANDNEIERVKSFFDQEKGSIAISQVFKSCNIFGINSQCREILKVRDFHNLDFRVERA